MGNLSRKKFNKREVELKIVMLKSNLRNIDISRKTNLSRPMVTQYIKGDRNCKRLDDFFDKLKSKK